jgi:predicted GNAT superfamily acetyltransferase
VPDDIVALRRDDPALARAWRLAVRDALKTAFDAGYRISGVTRTGWYVLDRG